MNGSPANGHDEGNVVGFVPEIEQVLDHQTRVWGVFSVQITLGERWTGGCVGAVALTHRDALPPRAGDAPDHAIHWRAGLLGFEGAESIASP